MPTAGSLIWTSIVPLLKISASVIAGFWLTKKGLFPPAASRGFSQVTMVSLGPFEGRRREK